ncbi:MAG: phosphomannose isomerase type II C-terminal cupin domain [Patescibacteria group bacterium]|nr:phosphomannose isomerase type II C-terminal cupin domain [Patescibacteria group bacterium]
MAKAKSKLALKPWGWYAVIETLPTYWIKEVFVRKGEKLSLQSHKNRSEVWVVLKGTIRAQKGKKFYTLREGDSVKINKKEKHRMMGVADSLVLEAAFGKPEEKDIIRYEDKYGRVK